VLFAVVTAVVAGCGDSGGSGGTIAFLLPENETPRYEAHDRPEFEKNVEELCSDCKVIYYNATGDASKQQSQAEAALAHGADVLAIDPVDTSLASAMVQEAKAKQVPVLSYNRLVENSRVDYYIGVNGEKVGELQAEALVKKLREDGSPSGPVVKLNGDHASSKGAVDGYNVEYGVYLAANQAGLKYAEEYETLDWSEKHAEREMQQAIKADGAKGFNGVYAASDEIAGGAIAAMKSAGIAPEEKPTTGQGATVAGLQRILAGEQYMTVYDPIDEEARVGAEFAVALVEGEEVPKEKITAEPSNGLRDVPAAFVEPVAVTKDNIEPTVVANGFITPEELCTGPYAEACKEAGIS